MMRMAEATKDHEAEASWAGWSVVWMVVVTIERCTERDQVTGDGLEEKPLKVELGGVTIRTR
jgi:hypothetical protein